jgi:hypothetical protein
MEDKIKVYFIEDANLLQTVDFNGVMFFEYEISKSDPRIKFINRKFVVLISDDDGEPYILNYYRDAYAAFMSAHNEIKRIYKKLSDAGKKRADVELERIDKRLSEILSEEKLNKNSKISQ